MNASAQRLYLCIDLKSFYASVECVCRGLDPMTARLVVAEPDRGRGALCLAVSPALKKAGVPSRCRIYEIPDELSYIIAPPRMALYISTSAAIYSLYLRYLAPEDIHVYSIDEAFLDVTSYLTLYGLSARELGQQILSDIHATFGLTAACGAGTNLYLAKVALDILAKHASNGLASLDEGLYRQLLWSYRPLTDFWRIGPGTLRRLASLNVHTMGDLAHLDITRLYRLFGVEAGWLMDHAWGREPVTLSQIKAYRPHSRCLSSSQVLLRDYSWDEGLLIAQEMTDELCLRLTDTGLMTDSLTLRVHYSRDVCPPSGGTANLDSFTDSPDVITQNLVCLYKKTVRRGVPLRRLTLTLSHVTADACEQYSLFTPPQKRHREKVLQQTVLQIKKQYGKNALLRGRDLLPAATARQRNEQIGGHRNGIS